jgi:hypothetical protein
MKVELVISVILRQNNLALHKKFKSVALGKSTKTQQYRKAGTKKNPGDGVFYIGQLKNLSRLDVGSLLAFRALRDFELNFLTFFEGLKTVHVDCGEVSEQIFTAVIRSDEAKTFGIIEPLNSTCCHKKNFQN